MSWPLGPQLEDMIPQAQLRELYQRCSDVYFIKNETFRLTLSLTFRRIVKYYGLSRTFRVSASSYHRNYHRPSRQLTVTVSSHYF